ncbi:malonyl-[acyl-carrier protein] O-methyltransferase BioC [Pantoea rodasii]|uniref:Malonyl-[acyl-carrier protein] O-methyltransferase n=1 Tax=Pantoea rodasii TaxID=1076549 RepID=A0A2M9WB33_9GAMM|nr:malonyl-ACP O-methyltransferase BioC [Pantoea rodasii]ORM65936.1 malonyl-[acyl-carrier protein] O-methyltransferase BioC [Pantoea rodasii]PJZ04751.1 malonyl-[acyl-carrier protein] O-methyltransferase BioC [Pantoea rodasii]
MTLQVNKQAVAQAFGRAAQHYEKHAELQRQCGDGLLALAPSGFGPHLLDAGCGTGWYSRYWRDRGRTLTALDLSSSMLDAAREQRSAQHYVQGDIDDLPLPDSSVDGVWSNLTVQWSSDLRHALQQFLRVTRPGGSVLFSTLLAGSLHEVHHAWARLDGRTHANRFLSEAQFADATRDLPLDGQQQTITLHFPSALSAMRSLKGIGATHLHDGRSAGMLTRSQLAQLEQYWPQDAHGYRLSYHLMYGVLHK